MGKIMIAKHEQGTTFISTCTFIFKSKHNHFHACCAIKIFLFVMSKEFNILFVHIKTILETSSEIFSNMVKSSTDLDKYRKINTTVRTHF